MSDREWTWSNDSSTSAVVGGDNSTNRGAAEWGLANRVVTSAVVVGGEEWPVFNSTNRVVSEWGPTNQEGDNWWGLLALALVFGTAAGNILVCLAISWERRLQNVTNYFLMSLAITDLMVAVLVMPLGILTLVRGFFPLPPVYCLAWICLDVLFCTASIMHLCTISVDRYLSLRYPMKFGRNKTRRRVTLKIVFVWLLSIAMSLPLCLMYSQDYNSVLVDGMCQIPDPLYKLIGSIISFYIPLVVMLLTYALTVRLLAVQEHNLGGCGGNSWSSGWLGGPQPTGMERRCTWRRLLTGKSPHTSHSTPPHLAQTHIHAQHAHHSSTDTDLTTLDTHDLWLQDTEPAPSTMSALHQFGAEMLRLSRGLESAMNTPMSLPKLKEPVREQEQEHAADSSEGSSKSAEDTRKATSQDKPRLTRRSGHRRRRRASTIGESCVRPTVTRSALERRRVSSYHEPSSKWTTSESSSAEEQKNDDAPPEIVNTCRKHSGVSEKDIGYTLLEGDAKLLEKTEPNEDKQKDDPLSLLPPPCTCPYFGDSEKKNTRPTTEVVIITTTDETSSPLVAKPPFPRRNQNYKLDTDSISSTDTRSLSSSLKSPARLSSRRARSSLTSESSGTVVTWESTPRRHRRGSFSSGGTVRTMVLSAKGNDMPKAPILRRSATLRVPRRDVVTGKADPESGILYRYGSTPGIARGGTVRTHHSRNSSVMSRTSSRHGRIIRLEQKATKVLGVVFFTFVILWAPFFVLNLLPSLCSECEQKIDQGVFDFVTWLGYASSMVNPIFYTIFNKVFRQAFKKVLLCKYHRKGSWKPGKAKL
ncbi:dopamine D2-like receptor [Macrosteles quadrilineatus]|uniref:dopamine D2-like receptor n=1 Tax=Macrosteles quadrilineatus TaxID=74068 RepID=UPI0023E0CDBA|nr:dopamine D2-like receptor [Macrosteles quadrilineatus]